MIVRNTVTEVLDAFEGEFAQLAAAVARGEYLLWLGSGISRDVVPNVPSMLKHLLEFLRSRIDDTRADCPYREALDDVLQIAGSRFTAAVDLQMPADTWPEIDDIVEILGNNYADVLDVPIRDKPGDFLVWDGLRVAETYGSSALEPGVEHLCVAILMLEGVVHSAPTTNWDGLVEAAMSLLIGDDSDSVIRVIVRPTDLTGPYRRAELIKFHGCAVQAAKDENGYRNLLIARKSQISGWASNISNRAMKEYLEHLFATRPALVLGLSVQDANIHTVLNEAVVSLGKSWPASPPAVVFAEQRLHYHHRHVLRVTYGPSYEPNTSAIESAALLGAFAKPTLIALVLYTLTDKLCKLIQSPDLLPMTKAELERLCSYLRSLQRLAGSAADRNPRAAVDAVVAAISNGLAMFRTGQGSAAITYQPLSIEPIEVAVRNPDFPHAALGRLAVAIAVLARGQDEGKWDIAMRGPTSADPCVLRATSRHRATRVFFVRNTRALATLEVEGHLDMADGDSLILQAEASAPVQVRSPRPRYGRTGRAGARRLDLEDLCASSSSADILFEGFEVEAAI